MDRFVDIGFSPKLMGKKSPEIPGTMYCGVFVFIELLNAVKVSCCILVVQAV
jgi:hypothetical protein